MDCGLWHINGIIYRYWKTEFQYISLSWCRHGDFLESYQMDGAYRNRENSVAKNRNIYDSELWEAMKDIIFRGFKFSLPVVFFCHYGCVTLWMLTQGWWGNVVFVSWGSDIHMILHAWTGCFQAFATSDFEVGGVVRNFGNATGDFR